MARDAQREHVIDDIETGKCGFDLVRKLRKLVRHISVHGVQPYRFLVCSAVESLYIMFHRIDHDIFALIDRARFGEGIEPLSLDLENGFDAEQSSHCSIDMQAS